MASDFYEVDLNTSPYERIQFLNYPTVNNEINKVLSLDGGNTFELKYFASYRNILPPGIPVYKYIANEHIVIFKSKLDNTMCSIRANIVWRNENNINILDEDYSEPSQFYSCYTI